MRALVRDAMRFSSHHHQDWFFGTVTLFVVGFAAAWFGYSWVAWTWMCGHALTSFGAAYQTGLGSRCSDVFSRDCIWYNLVMAACNAVVACFVA